MLGVDSLFRVAPGKSIQIIQLSDALKLAKRGRRAFVVPTNRNLEGLNFPYFPRGGPIPLREKTWTSSWGGMEAGSNMLYPSQTVEGHLRLEAGAAELDQKLRKVKSRVGTLDEGKAVLVDPTEKLIQVHGIHSLVFVTTPFYSDDPDGEILKQCYRSCIECIRQDFDHAVFPLLGAGARGFHDHVAVSSAVNALTERLDLLPQLTTVVVVENTSANLLTSTMSARV